MLRFLKWPVRLGEDGGGATSHLFQSRQTQIGREELKEWRVPCLDLKLSFSVYLYYLAFWKFPAWFCALDVLLGGRFLRLRENVCV